MTILIVEDEMRIVAFVRKGLQAQGYRVEAVDSGYEALDRMENGGIELVILDLGLPDIDGLDVLKRLRADGCTLPIIVLTARTDVADRVRGLDLGADDYVPKPFAFEELAARVRARLRDGDPGEGRRVDRPDGPAGS